MNALFQIFTDSSCDLPQSSAAAYGLHVLPLSVLMDGKVYHNQLDGSEIGFADFYAALRAGSVATTSAVNPEAFRAAMEPVLQAGQDLLYIGFSSGLSTTYQSACIAAAELREQYPERTILTVDTLAASLGQGLLIHLAVQQRNAGASVQAVADYLEQTKLHLCHWFTVDDLMFLKRGGRVSASTALLGTALQIKPVMHMDDEGHLINVSKARGRKASINALVDRMAELAIDPASQTVFISHGDCLSDAEYAAEQIRTRLGVQDILINYVGPVIGSHSGPGTLAIFFLGEHR